MKWISFLLGVCALPGLSSAQPALYNNGATLTVSTGTTVTIAGDVTNQTGTLSNAGTLWVSGQTTNNGTITAAAGSTLLLTGTAAQTLTGTQALAVKNVVVNNPAGITLATPLQVDGSLTFTAGLLTATTASAPVIFTANATIANTPTDGSHINGYVRKLGTGTFTFPVGSATNYQPVTVNLTANGAGLTALYTAGDAGAGGFTTAGSEATPLLSYNAREYWDLHPVSTASGTVTLYWDGVNETAYPTASRRVAHKRSGGWQNEGGAATGTTSAGAVTSNAISSWSPFTIGALSFPLPVRWLNVSGSLDAGGKATLRWQVAEENVSSYEVQKSDNGRSFQPLAVVNGLGSGVHSYLFTEDAVLEGQAYYRILQQDADGRTGYSAVVTLRNNDGKGATLSLYPNPASNSARLSVPANLVGTKARLYNSAGKLVRQYSLTAPVQELDLTALPQGTYLLKAEGGQTLKLLKQRQ